MSSELLPALELIAVSVVTSVAGQTVIKLGLRQSVALSSPGAVIGAVLDSPLVLLGLALYALGALAWIAVLSRVDLSYAYPFVALNMVLVTVVSRLLLHETVPALRWAGLLAVCVGVVLVARSANG